MSTAGRQVDQVETSTVASRKQPVELPPLEDAIDPEMARVLAEKSEAERLRIAWGMWTSARRMVARMVAAELPSATDEEREREVARRMSHGG